MNGKILLTNIGILFGYMVVLTLAYGESVLFLSVLPIAIHVVVNFGLFLKHFERNKLLARTYLLSMVMVLLIGFPSCLGLSTIAK